MAADSLKPAARNLPAARDSVTAEDHSKTAQIRIDKSYRHWTPGRSTKERRCVDCGAVFVRVGQKAVGGNRKRCEKCREATVVPPSQYLAQHAISRHSRNGSLLVPSYCQRCADDCRPEAHHFAGYEAANALKVIWLCRACHSAEHVAMRKAAQ